MRRCFSLIPMLWLLAVTAPAAMAEDARPGGLPEDINPGELKVLKVDGKAAREPLRLPLRHTDVRIQVTGFVARATVIQHYDNPFDTPIEAIYNFPLPNKAAVDGMSMRIGDKRIRGLIKRREEARELYEKAKAEGRRSGLLEQERPNIFTQSVGNIMPGDAIEVEITYVDILDFRDEGAYELVFPMVVGPRYIPGQATGRQGSGWAQDTDQVPDASRITPPVLRPGERNGHDISLSVELDAALKIHGVHSVSHAVDIAAPSESRRTVTLHASDTLPNKDFVLRYQVAGQAPEVALISHHSPQKGGYFTFMALPQRQVDDMATVPRDLIFILDTSGSMRGFPLEKSKQAMYRMISGMRPSDRFNVIRFAGDTGTLWPQARPMSEQNKAEAVAFIERLKGGGGTEMRQGISQALAQPSDPQRVRIAVLMTDGYVGNELGILNSIEQERRGARVFTLGVGSSPNRFLLDRAATVGMGEAFYLRHDQTADATIERFYTRVDRPNLAHVSIDWNGLEVFDVTPARIPDLWQGQPILVHGRYKQGGAAQITVNALLGSEKHSWSIPVVLLENADENAVMAAVWARAKVKNLTLAMSRGGDKERLVDEITQLGLEYAILTQWTSFVAVEEKTVNQGGRQKTVVQALQLPEGVDYSGVFPDAELAQPMSYAPRGMHMFSGKSAAPGLLNRMAPAPAMQAANAPPPAPSAPPARPSAAESGAAMDVAKPGAEFPGCTRNALSVSGGLHYAAVDAHLRERWPDLCRRLQGAYQGAIYFNVELLVGSDGTVTQVQLRSPGAASPGLTQRVRAWFKQLRFGRVSGGGYSRVTLDLILK